MAKAGKVDERFGQMREGQAARLERFVECAAGRVQPKRLFAGSILVEAARYGWLLSPLARAGGLRIMRCPPGRLCSGGFGLAGALRSGLLQSNAETAMTELTLYHCVGARSFRVLWALEELELKYKLVVMAFPPRQHAKEFFQINPLGTVPAMVDGNGVLTESSAICEYLSQTHAGGALSVGRTEADYGPYLNWLSAADATLTFPQTLILRYSYFEPPERRQPQVVEDYTRWFLGRLRGVENALQRSGAYLCQDRFSNADIAVGYALMLAEFLELRSQFAPLTEAYWQRLRQRSAFAEALDAERRAAELCGIDPKPSPLLRP